MLAVFRPYFLAPHTFTRYTHALPSGTHAVNSGGFFTLPVSDLEGTPASGSSQQKVLESFGISQEYSLFSSHAENCNVAAHASPSPIGPPLHSRSSCSSNPPSCSSSLTGNNRCCPDVEEKAQEELRPRLDAQTAEILKECQREVARLRDQNAQLASRVCPLEKATVSTCDTAHSLPSNNQENQTPGAAATLQAVINVEESVSFERPISPLSCERDSSSLPPASIAGSDVL